MAWRSGGVTNDELVDNLKRFGVIHTQAVEDGFRAVDRKFFVPPNKKNLAYADQPIREGKLHISAPHIYGSVCEALDLVPGSSSSFLNIGSGTGYLTSLVAQILGSTSTTYSIEVQGEAVAHFQHATSAWKHSRGLLLEQDPVLQVICGDGLNIEGSKGEAAIGFDRIYIGAAIERHDLPKIANLLRTGGVMVGPVGDELVKILRLAQTPTSSFNSSPIPRSTHGRPPLLSTEFVTKVLSPVLFTPLVRCSSSDPIIIQSRIWGPAVHRYYPESFRKSCKEVLLCSAAPKTQGNRSGSGNHTINLASILPKAMWLEVLSYTHRHWFEPPQSEETELRHRVQMLESSLEHAQEARHDLEKRLRIAEGERELYRSMARNWQSRIERVLGESLAGDILDGAIVVMRDDETSDEDEDESHSDESTDEATMDEHEAEEMDEDTVAEMEDDSADVLVNSGAAASSLTGRQIRAVSISSGGQV